MPLHQKDGATPYRAIAYQGAILDIDNILVDTGSATTILAADIVASIQIRLS
jgi:hypothetical protein